MKDHRCFSSFACGGGRNLSATRAQHLARSQFLRPFISTILSIFRNTISHIPGFSNIENTPKRNGFRFWVLRSGIDAVDA